MFRLKPVGLFGRLPFVSGEAFSRHFRGGSNSAIYKNIVKIMHCQKNKFEVFQNWVSSVDIHRPMSAYYLFEKYCVRFKQKKYTMINV